MVQRWSRREGEEQRPSKGEAQGARQLADAALDEPMRRQRQAEVVTKSLSASHPPGDHSSRDLRRVGFDTARVEMGAATTTSRDAPQVAFSHEFGRGRLLIASR